MHFKKTIAYNEHVIQFSSSYMQTLENVQSAKYLGITITDNMD